MTDLPVLKLKSLTNFPVQASGRVGITVDKTNGAFFIDIDYSKFLPPIPALPPDITPFFTLIWNNISNAYELCPLALSGGTTPSDDLPLMDGAADPGSSTLFSRSDHVHPTDTSRASVGISRAVTAAGAVTIAVNDRVVAINKTVGAATAVTLPLASTKDGPVTISDFKRDAGTNNITITATSPDLIQGLATLTLASNGASVQLKPIPGVGYSL